MPSSYTVLLNNDLFRAAITQQARPILMDIAEYERALEIRLFGLPKSGRTYYRPRPARGKYVASAPGQPPAIRSGNLFRNQGRPRFIAPLTVERVINTEYAEYLEQGTKRMAPRPFVRPAVETVKERFKAGQLGRF